MYVCVCGCVHTCVTSHIHISIRGTVARLCTCHHIRPPVCTEKEIRTLDVGHIKCPKYTEFNLDILLTKSGRHPVI